MAAVLTIPDDAPPGMVIGSVQAPCGYVVELIYDSDGRFALSGSNLVVGETLLTPGSYGPGGTQSWPGPVLRAMKAGEPYSDLVLRPEIAVAPARAPSTIPGLKAAWLSDVGVDVNASGQVHAWLGAWQTPYSLSQTTLEARPSLLSGYGPGGLPGILFDSAKAQFMSIDPPLSMAGGTIVAIYQPRDTAANKTLLGSGNRFLWQTSASSVSLNMGATAIANPVANANLTINRLSLLIVTHDAASGAFGARVDGVVASGGGGAGLSTAAFTMVGKHKNANYGNYVLSALLIYDRVLSSQEIAELEAWGMGRRTSEWFCAADGLPGNTGFTAASPKPAAQGFLSSQSFRAWDRIRSRGGDLMLGTITAISGGMTLGKPLRAMTYGHGRPRWWGAGPSALAYDGAYPVQTAALTRANPLGMIWWYREGLRAPPVQLFARALDQDRSFQLVANLLQLRLEPGRNANDEILVIPADLSDQQLYGIGASYFELHDHDVRHFLGQMWSPQGQRTVLRDCYLGFSCDDGHSPGGAAHDCSFNEITGTGTSLSITRGPGDGVSLHGGGAHTLRYNWIHDCLGPGVRNEEGSSVVIEGNNVENCAAAMRIIRNPAYPGPAMALYRGNRIQRGAGALQRDGLLLDSNLPANIEVVVSDNLFVGEGVTDGLAVRTNGFGSVSGTGNVQLGFSALGM
ncbi:right-handed parallel beta-helix repeat-containing protein [Caulobacter endophyticus]|uniref:right-handed parallel beta-helix repeat-containing protein n=1 Tax=Caulobacter endophyticus TaxID=2172652 RepID=UPI00240FAC08|nr:right-handed parallel beta-helix repeat-containing protein [Caulobacter endophyticus]MDG2528259.1 right-handed parallel beta-helix repeat-containing protein [Caulobacter endophyticus]